MSTMLLRRTVMAGLALLALAPVACAPAKQAAAPVAAETTASASSATSTPSTPTSATPESSTAGPAGGKGSAQAGPTAIVQVSVTDATKLKHLKGTEIVLGGVVFKPAKKGKTDSAMLEVAIGPRVKFTVYPDGRTGKTIAMPIVIYEGYEPGAPQNGIEIAISDGYVQVWRSAKDAMGMRTYPRF